MFLKYLFLDIRMVQNMPTLLARDQPVVAIITRLYCEKLAVDAMIDNKITYVRYKTEGRYSLSMTCRNSTTPFHFTRKKFWAYLGFFMEESANRRG